jgi:hypothetical protein
MDDTDREWEEERARYSAMSEADFEAMPTPELIEAFYHEIPEATPWGRAWYQQLPARERFQMRVKSWRDLLEAYVRKKPSTYEGFLAVLELVRRACDAGYTRTGQWLKVQVRLSLKSVRDEMIATEREHS